MPAETLCCPYCNSYLNSAEHAPGSVACPRCGESFPYRTGVVHASAETNGEAIGAHAPIAKRRGSPTATGLLILGGMFLLGALAIAFILLTHDFRRSNDPVAGPSSALSYLPADANVAAMIHVPEVEKQPAGTGILTLIGMAETENGPDATEQLLGVPQSNLAILLLSFKSDADRGRPILLVQTIHPYDEDRVRALLSAGPPIHDGYRTVYQTPAMKLGLGAVWFPATNVIAFAPDVHSLEAVPAQPAEDTLPESLGHLMKNPDTWPIWVTGQGQNWKSALSSWVSVLPAPTSSILDKVDGFAGWVDFGHGLTLIAKIDCADAGTATELAQMFQTVKLPEVKLTVTHADVQVVAETTTDLDTLRRVLGAAFMRPAQK